ncbi:MAG: cation diffusion facilitator family transporter [Anaerolineae bacterium]
MKNFQAIRYVLLVTMALNLAAMLAKLVVGYFTGSLSLMADGFDSLFDAASNVIGLVGIYIAARPPDPGHPYGHRKFETLTAVGIAMLLFVTCTEIARSAFIRLTSPLPPDVNVWSFAALLFSIGVHLFVSTYEERRGRTLKSDVLVADALHTRADIYISVSVIVGLVVVRAGYPIIDVLLALAIAVAIAKIGLDIIRFSFQVLADAAAIDITAIEGIVMAVEGVKHCHHIRSRGHADDVQIDLHIQVAPQLGIERAHAIAHQVKAKLLTDLEGVSDVTIHIEPGQPAEGESLAENIRAETEGLTQVNTPGEPPSSI